MLRILFVGLIVAILGGFGWWYWHQATGGGVVRDSTPSWAIDSQHVIFASELNGKKQIVVADIAGRQRLSLMTTRSNEGSPSYSPDGQTIAFESDRDGNPEIYKVRANGEAQQPLTKHPARDLSPSWSPDGRWIVFVSDRDNPEFDIYRMDTEGKNVERLTNGGPHALPQYSPDGSQIAFQAVRDIYVLQMKSATVRRVTHEPMNGMYPTWSSDGSNIGFMSRRNGRTEIFTAQQSGAGQDLLVSMPTGDAIEPRWSPDGTHIAFVHVPNGRVQDNQDASQQRVVYVVDVKTKRLTRLSR